MYKNFLETFAFIFSRTFDPGFGDGIHLVFLLDRERQKNKTSKILLDILIYFKLLKEEHTEDFKRKNHPLSHPCIPDLKAKVIYIFICKCIQFKQFFLRNAILNILLT